MDMCAYWLVGVVAGNADVRACVSAGSVCLVRGWLHHMEFVLCPLHMVEWRRDALYKGSKAGRQPGLNSRC